MFDDENGLIACYFIQPRNLLNGMLEVSFVEHEHMETIWKLRHELTLNWYNGLLALRVHKRHILCGCVF